MLFLWLSDHFDLLYIVVCMQKEGEMCGLITKSNIFKAELQSSKKYIKNLYLLVLYEP